MFGRQICLRDNSIEFMQVFLSSTVGLGDECCLLQSNAGGGGMRNRVEGPAGGLVLVPGAHHSLAFFAAGS